MDQERRIEQRIGEPATAGALSFVFRKGSERFVSEVLNYHHRGASLRLDMQARDALKASDANTAPLDCYLGQKLLKRSISYRVVWDRRTLDGSVGLEFLAPLAGLVERAGRAAFHPQFSPSLSGSDPLDPNRRLYFRALDMSVSGFLLSTSLTNRHLLPGMDLSGCHLNIPGDAAAYSVDLTIENTRKADESGMFLVGVSTRRLSGPALAAIKAYLATLTAAAVQEGVDAGPMGSGMLPKALRQGLTFRTAATQADYDQVLKLRFSGYQAHGKVKDGATWRDMGEGLEHEGAIIAAFLGGQLVAAMELRFGSEGRPLRLLKMPGGELPPGLALATTVELNKLVVHPRIQGSDIVLGMMQKAHALIVARGGYDVVVAATDKLWPLYERIGFAKSGLRVAHPTLTGHDLNILVIRRETYLGSEGLNAYNWSVVYEAVHSHMVAIGFAAPVRLSLRQRLARKLTPVVARLLGKRRPSAPAGALAGKASRGARPGFIDPVLTARHMIAPVLLPYLLEADEMIGARAVDQILLEIGIPRAYFDRQSNWVSVACLDRFLDRFAVRGDIAELSRRAGRRQYQPDVLGVKYLVLKHLIYPELAFETFDKLMPRFNRSRTYRVLANEPGRAKVSIGVATPDLLPKHRESCLNWQSCFESYIGAMTGASPVIHKSSCCYDGDEACTYELRWESNKQAVTVAKAAYALGLLAVCVLLPLGAYLPIADTILVALFASASGLGWRFRLAALKERRRHRTLNEQLETIEDEAAERYAELQEAKTVLDHRYHESRLLEETAKVIQSTQSLQELLRVSLDQVCKSFGFDRAFVMLLDKDASVLRMAAVAQVEEGLGDLWRYTVDVSKPRENSLLLSSVFHSRQPVLIKDVEAHLFQLNEASRALVRQLGSRGFIMVPVPSESGCSGVAVADKTQSGKLLTKTDLVLLQRIAQHVGIALDKQAKLDAEAALRLLFQKFVPSRIEELTRGAARPSLGGQIRDVICMFLDIRDFTRISSALPPHAILEVVNRVFGMVHPVVTQSQGIVDKFLGDGVLATWGTYGDMAPHSDQAVGAAVEIFRQLPRVNASLQSDGLPAVRLGIGVHRGPAIVGIVGAEDRMEFTCIGNTVNLASRIEGLCKQFDARVVVSGAVYAGLTPAIGTAWVEAHGVGVRGVDAPLTVAYLPNVEARTANLRSVS